MSETSFSLTYGVEAMIPIEISLLTMRVDDFTRSDNGTQTVWTLDFLEEKRDMIFVQLTNYQQKLAKRYNRNIKPREFVAGVLVLQKEVGSMKDLSAGQLALNWEGPYRVTAKARMGAYYLEYLEERPLPQPWNVYNLKKYYL